jgi:FkbM family methyltransferase
MSALSLARVRGAWNSDSSPVALRTKQFVASVLPDRMLLALKKRYYVRLLRADSDATMETDARALPLLVREGDFVIDVGAFVGFYTQRLSRLAGATGMVWSFEPMPPTFEILSTAIRRLGIRNTQLFPYAVSERESTATMEIPRFHGGGESWWDARIVWQRAPRPSYRQFVIRTTTLDSLLAANERPVAFIKIDAEYHELHCIRGALASLRRWQPAIQVEALANMDDERSDLHAMAGLLRPMGYSAYRFDGRGFHLRQRHDQQQNLFFLCDHHVRPR